MLRETDAGGLHFCLISHCWCSLEEEASYQRTPNICSDQCVSKYIRKHFGVKCRPMLITQSDISAAQLLKDAMNNDFFFSIQECNIPPTSSTKKKKEKKCSHLLWLCSGCSKVSLVCQLSVVHRHLRGKATELFGAGYRLSHLREYASTD